MCGLAGKLLFDPAGTVEADLLARMAELLRRRGPDGAGVWCDGRIGLAHTRLAILDLSPAGRQPMANESGDIWLTFNGEIYNHQELRRGLEQRGHRYRSATDTETIIHLYEEYGAECVQRLRGMFAFALWDGRRQRLMLARDRFGKKPLCYCQTADAITFASEIKALLQDPEVPMALDEASLHHYLTYGYVPGPATAFRAIRKLPPATVMLWEGSRTTRQRYWRPAYLPKLTIGEEEAAERLRDLLREAVRIRLMGDVPLGAFLSGGLDSSSIVALMAEASAAPVKTFSIGFDDHSFDEVRYARAVADRYATDHHEFTVTPDALAALPELVWAYGEPYADSSALATYCVCREASRHVTVALNGDGGDETFAGYDRYLATRLADRYQALPAWLRRGVIAPLVRCLPESTRRRHPVGRLKRFVSALASSPQRRYAQWMSMFDEAGKAQLYNVEFRARLAEVDSLALIEDAYREADSQDFVEQTQAVDIATYLPDDLLVKVDIASMMHGLECRSPFLDHEVAEFATHLPAHLKLRGRTTKYLLRRAMAGHLPACVLRRGKQGFGVPVGRWFRRQLRPLAQEVLLDPRSAERGIFDRAAVRKLLSDHAAGRADHGQRIWQLLFLELWFRTYLDRPRSALTGPLSSLHVERRAPLTSVAAEPLRPHAPGSETG
jgi:asparagine synthase (glutamine-hydrolysing)